MKTYKLMRINSSGDTELMWIFCNPVVADSSIKLFNSNKYIYYIVIEETNNG